MRFSSSALWHFQGGIVWRLHNRCLASDRPCPCLLHAVCQRSLAQTPQAGVCLMVFPEADRDHDAGDGGAGIRRKVIPLMEEHNKTTPEFEATEDYFKVVLRRG